MDFNGKMTVYTDVLSFRERLESLMGDEATRDDAELNILTRLPVLRVSGAALRSYTEKLSLTMCQSLQMEA